MKHHRVVYRATITVTLLAFTLSAQVFAQGRNPTDAQIDAALNELGGVTFQRLTSEGQFRGCELTYRAVFRDFRANKGDPVVAFGSVTSYYFPGKAFNLSLKTRTAVLTPGEGARKEFQPAFASLSLGQSLQQFKRGEFKCEDAGICVSYADGPEFPLMKLTMERWLAPGPTVTVTTSKGGIDKDISLRALLEGKSPEKAESAKAFFAFHSCLNDEVLKSMINDMEKAIRK